MTDAQEFERFAERHALLLSRLAYRLTGHRESALDLTQEVLLDAYRQWSKLTEAGNQSAYLRRMLVNRHLTGLRRRTVDEVTTAELPEPRRESGSAPGTAVDDRDAMWQALAALSDRERTVLVLRFYEGLDDPSIAALVGCRRSTVRSLAARGLTALRTNPHLQDPAVDPATRSPR